ncbi:NAD(P)-binding domain-containing protein [Kibdelosporangium philippinense]|uniref:NAD(P)-binding domain-containing protein n=1 Tax=Kibdelosporangium philippinense TaxID=211113 RepID=A0ABS8ZN03_9PSEU|nr:NAD(P)-binding domain-containing protein [Kibdelosporangium philippinense]MCE7008335.1 NAD(P)-binding domain-containing protein [Kibdelosporangium philippinense]
MRIGILGAGDMAQGLGAHWVKAGHEVKLSHRDESAEAAAFGDVILVAVPAEAVPEVLGATDLAGKVLIDCTNAIIPGEWTVRTSMARRVAELAPEAKVVKAFNLCHESVWKRQYPHKLVPICGDDPSAINLVKRLVADIGCTPAEAGPLSRAEVLEAAAAFVIGLSVAGFDPRAAVDM